MRAALLVGLGMSTSWKSLVCALGANEVGADREPLGRRGVFVEHAPKWGDRLDRLTGVTGGSSHGAQVSLTTEYNFIPDILCQE
jgi:hypothetical protein